MKKILLLASLYTFIPCLLASEESSSSKWWIESGLSYGMNQRYVTVHETDFDSSSPRGGDFTMGYKPYDDISFFLQLSIGNDSDSAYKSTPLSYTEHSYELDTLQIMAGMRMHNQITDSLSCNFNISLGLTSHDATLTRTSSSYASAEVEMIGANNFTAKLGLQLQYYFTENIYAYCEGSFVSEFVSDMPQRYEGTPLNQSGEYRMGIGIQF